MANRYIKKMLWSFATIVIVVTGLVVSVSCRNFKVDKSEKHKVLVIHSWDNVGEEGTPFNEMMESSFRSRGMGVDIRHIYLNMARNDMDVINTTTWPRSMKEIESWKPEIILINDDPALNFAISGLHDEFFKSVPVVYAGVTTLNTNKLHEYRNFCGFEEEIDIAKNCELMMEITNEPKIYIELDHTEEDAPLWETLNEIVKDSNLYIDNLGMKKFEHENHKIGSGKICLSTISVLTPQLNSQYGDSIGLQNTIKAYNNAKYLWQLQVKFDMMSNTLIEKSRRPQFTCIREQFNNPDNIIILGGYFTSTQTQIDDQVRYAVRILNGADPKLMPIEKHSKGYYMDYNAMKLIKPMKSSFINTTEIKEMEYKDFKDRFEIINAPFEVAHPVWYITSIIGSIVLLAILIGLAAWLPFRRRTQKRLAMVNVLNKEQKLSDILLKNSHSIIWKSSQGSITIPKEFADHFHIPATISFIDFEQYIHPSTINEWERMKNFRQNMGKSKVRLFVSFNKEDWHWYDVFYEVTEEAINKWEFNGLFLNVDAEVQRAKMLEQAVKEAKEVETKTFFLENIQAKLDSPMKEVIEYSTKITNSKTALNQDKMEEYVEHVHQGTQKLIRLIDAVVKESNDIKEHNNTDEA